EPDPSQAPNVVLVQGRRLDPHCHPSVGGHWFGCLADAKAVERFDGVEGGHAGGEHTQTVRRDRCSGIPDPSPPTS
ncbi:MAG: hypothetical protein QOJ62_3100, partial [Actinomycetota bacterium]|nr:hypothetical protein [Actinomycetota bacterium]